MDDNIPIASAHLIASQRQRRSRRSTNTPLVSVRMLDEIELEIESGGLEEEDLPSKGLHNHQPPAVTNKFGTATHQLQEVQVVARGAVSEKVARHGLKNPIQEVRVAARGAISEKLAKHGLRRPNHSQEQSDSDAVVDAAKSTAEENEKRSNHSRTSNHSQEPSDAKPVPTLTSMPPEHDSEWQDEMDNEPPPPPPTEASLTQTTDANNKNNSTPAGGRRLWAIIVIVFALAAVAITGILCVSGVYFDISPITATNSSSSLSMGILQSICSVE
ncbi:expressed unknown protein [Seminavis robusta]|uniref:Uncharacterized protein n=1 Tax=Seminavis robusta TaxID=568900 RepID=A0A9N8DFP8_9STRA|nr:expressed unknown protein [Seminavis robusta]|eukprot:Sro46_g027510.1 n/a (273) ;mRNA; r:91763-92670